MRKLQASAKVGEVGRFLFRPYFRRGKTAPCRKLPLAFCWVLPFASSLAGGLPVVLDDGVLIFYLMIEMENISLRSAVRVIRAFAARETVLVVAVAAALASCALVPPDACYAAYVDWHTLALLFCLMAVVSGFRSLGVLDAAGAWLVARARTQRAVAGVLVGLAFFASMAVTNDVALITFVPLALVVLRRAGMEGRMCLVATLMTIAVNLGSMFTPVGNPQNLYLFTASGMGVGEFLQLTGPYTAASGAMLALACVLRVRGDEVRGAGGVGRFASSGGFASDDTADNSAMQVPPARWTAPEGSASDFMPARSANGASPASSSIESASLECFPARSRKRLAMYGVLFACCLAAVLGVLDVRVLLALVLGAFRFPMQAYCDASTGGCWPLLRPCSCSWGTWVAFRCCTRRFPRRWAATRCLPR